MFGKIKARMGRTGAVIGTTAVLAVAGAVPSFAADPDIDSVVTTQFDSLKSTVTTTLVPALFGLVILGVVVGLAIKYLSKGARKA